MSGRLHLNALDALAYWADCAIATYETARSRKSTSQADRKRLRSIAQGMIEDAVRFGAKEEDLTKLRERFERAEASPL